VWGNGGEFSARPADVKRRRRRKLREKQRRRTGRKKSLPKAKINPALVEAMRERKISDS
jgi:hypothetical protein